MSPSLGRTRIPGHFEYLLDSAEIYFNRPDIKVAIHESQEVD